MKAAACLQPFRQAATHKLQCCAILKMDLPDRALRLGTKDVADVKDIEDGTGRT